MARIQLIKPASVPNAGAANMEQSTAQTYNYYSAIANLAEEQGANKRELELQALEEQLKQARNKPNTPLAGGIANFGDDMVDVPRDVEWQNAQRDLQRKRMKEEEDNINSRKRQNEYFLQMLSEAMAAMKQGGPDVRRNFNIG